MFGCEQLYSFCTYTSIFDMVKVVSHSIYSTCINVMRIRKMLISYIKLDHIMLYSINYGILTYMHGREWRRPFTLSRASSLEWR